MKRLVRVVMVGALTAFAASAHISVLAQTQTKPPPKPVPAAKPAATSVAKPAARPLVRHPVFVPAPPVIELDEMAVVPDLPTVLSTEERDRYRRIFQAQASNQWAQADADISHLT